MTIKWNKLFLKCSVWITLEIIFTLLGVDDVIDYSEYILETKRNYVYQKISVQVPRYLSDI